ncbi:SRPBCC family protein [Dyella sp. C11]|uniref:SRPBCC family protein n=1 Tax=Dyella sp. C11 TaxID=2126991 RepID=UPI000D64DDC0|nr:SRPBCC family protein [Dyella sp. C11]
MARAASSIDLPMSPDRVWSVVGGFGSLPDWLPYIPRSDLMDGGRVRHLTTEDGQTIVERLMAFDEQARRYTYHILKAPFPVADYYSTLKVSSTGAGKSSRVEWEGEFTPVGITDQEATDLFKTIYDTGLKALAKTMEG